MLETQNKIKVDNIHLGHVIACVSIFSFSFLLPIPFPADWVFSGGMFVVTCGTTFLWFANGIARAAALKWIVCRDNALIIERMDDKRVLTTFLAYVKDTGFDISYQTFKDMIGGDIWEQERPLAPKSRTIIIDGVPIPFENATAWIGGANTRNQLPAVRKNAKVREQRQKLYACLTELKCVEKRDGDGYFLLSQSKAEKALGMLLEGYDMEEIRNELE